MQTFLSWGSPFFIPEDELVVIINGPKFRSVEWAGPERALEAIKGKYIHIEREVWGRMRNYRFCNFVDDIVIRRRLR